MTPKTSERAALVPSPLSGAALLTYSRSELIRDLICEVCDLPTMQDVDEWLELEHAQELPVIVRANIRTIAQRGLLFGFRQWVFA